jgi:endo-1,3-1,4-beta-glycanase ExoK
MGAARAETSPSLAGPASVALEKSFVDRFDKFLTRRWEISSGWSNGPTFLCSWRGANVNVDGTGLVLSLNKFGSPPRYYCAEVKSRRPVLYGVFEVRMQAAEGSGLNSAFFLHRPSTDTTPQALISSELIGKDAAGEFVDLAMIWTPTEITWLRNGAVVKSVKSDTYDVPRAPMSIVLSSFIRDQPEFGPFFDTTIPATATVKWVAYTALGEPCQFPESVACTAKFNTVRR